MTIDRPAWLDEAWRETGVREVAGAASNARILQFYRDVGHATVSSDAVAWCAAFLGACLERAGFASTRSLLARSYLDWGTPLREPKLGAVAVHSRGSDPGQGHVGFFVGATVDHIYLLGGNQSDAVNVQPFEMSRLLGLRWPVEKSVSVNTASGELFDASLAHVLKMEGNWSDDPHDPGGPTNRGITLAVYAAAKSVALTDANRAVLVEELKAINPAVVRDIYLTRYWTPSRAADLPPPLALMHFDAAVNHGVGNAARMLQEALAVEVDGEIGPQTLAASRATPASELVARYADIRRTRYRSLSHFWRFGRGWLRRVDQTVSAAGQIFPAGPVPMSLDRTNGDTDMTTETTSTSGKWWAHSLTVWGAVITAASTVLPALGPLLGLDITSDLVQELGQGVVDVAQAVAGLAGIIMTVYGRTRANATLERRKVTFQL